jgi:uncharacterized protein (TIGR02391 family)
MADLNTLDKKVLEKLFKMEEGYVLDFTNRSFREFFRDDLKIDIYNEKYNYETGSKANRLRAFWSIANNKLVGKSILRLIEYIETQLALDNFSRSNFPEKRIRAGGKVAQKLLSGNTENINGVTISQASFKKGSIKISLRDEIFDHVQKFLTSGHYFTAVEEAYKIVREKLRNITGEEKATNAFKKENYKKIFGHLPKDAREEDFFRGIKFLHMALQFLRNEKSHTPANKINKNLAIHYIALASLAFDLINRNEKNKKK